MKVEIKDKEATQFNMLMVGICFFVRDTTSTVYMKIRENKEGAHDLGLNLHTGHAIHIDANTPVVPLPEAVLSVGV